MKKRKKLPLNGIVKEFYSNKMLSVTGRVSKGIKTGVWKYYLRNGQLRAEIGRAHV